MKRIITYSIVLILFLSCRQQYDYVALSGSYGGVEGGNRHRNPISFYVSLELNKDMTCSLRKTFDLIVFEGQGEWRMLNKVEIEIKCNNNPVERDILNALMSGGYIEDTLTVKVLSKNKLKLGDTILKRKD